MVHVRGKQSLFVLVYKIDAKDSIWIGKDLVDTAILKHKRCAVVY